MSKARSKVGELAGIKRAIDELGAEILVSYDPPDPMTRGEMAVARTKVSVAAVEHCIPRWPGGLVTGEATFAVCGAAPYLDDHDVMWTGRGGQLMRSGLSRAGCDISGVAWLNMSPERVRDSPSKQQLVTWRSWAMDCLVAANVSYVLLVGATAVKCWRADLAVEQVWLGGHHDNGVALWKVAGRPLIVGAMVSPFSVSRDPAIADRWRIGLTRWTGIVTEDRGIDALGNRCVAKNCSAAMWAFDGDGVAYCRGHWRPDGQDRTTRGLINQQEGQGVLI